MATTTDDTATRGRGTRPGSGRTHPRSHGTVGPTPGQRTLAGSGRPLREHLFRLMLLSSLAVAIVFLVTLLTYVVVQGWPRLDARLWENFPSVRRPERAGAQSAITGTLWVISLTALLVLPVGIAGAIYLEEYADRDRWWNRMIELNIQNLAAVPSIIYGILGLGIFARLLGLGSTVLAAALTLALLVLPVVIISCREAIRSVPTSIRLGSLALGATKWQTVSRQVLPAAVPGMATGTILALSRAIGEAAPLLLLGAVTYVAFNPEGLDSAYTVLPIQIYNWIAQSREEFKVLASAAIVVLLALLLLMNSVAIYVRNRYQKRW
jgi:phosphate transport system permease protein